MDWNKTPKRLRFNKKVRRMTRVPSLKKNAEKLGFVPSVLCDNCTAGMILHDFAFQFKSPTVNLYFEGYDFFDFAEDMDYYFAKDVVQINEEEKHPVGKIFGDETHKDIILHFLHYKSFSEANDCWERRKKRIDKEHLFLMYTFMKNPEDETLYDRAQALPFEKKVIFINHPMDKENYPSYFYIRNFEMINGVGQMGFFMDPFTRYYDQFDSLHFFKTGEIRASKREQRIRKRKGVRK